MRRQPVGRLALPRSLRELETEYGPAPIKVAHWEVRPLRAKPEYEGCRRIALERGIPIRLVYEAAARRLASEG